MSNPQRVALVTGASRGIGAAIAERLGQDGLAVVVAFSGDEEGARAVVRRIEAAGGRALASRVDIRDASAVQAVFDATEKAFGGLDVLVNNAGVMELGRIDEMTDDTFSRQLSVNLMGSFHAMREASRRLRRGGSIVNLSSSVVRLLQPTYGPYAATKAAIEALTMVLARELRGRDITVNALAPGPTATELFLKGKPPAVVEQLTKAPPLERLGTPEDIARAVSFLAGPDGRWVNGQVLRANGGLV
ncbi:3-oxoacyl-ACP reductase [Myxococcus stipitatus DSM 14675]|uniref:3-oxoacyl-ACP reductase n=1 Tax=Myxococcus stipitatus (strain DSM 14675 / JCM 12634 / Mx s8) TaxID=1278073 RepID=L7UJ03_MYXSD|nr:SDR family oxidoreductase [Myxococcus stipitatus]AGC47890.1 3-oxoacyl-ACP reductase [Myxococcus stipitatus DSM 14675]